MLQENYPITMVESLRMENVAPKLQNFYKTIGKWKLLGNGNMDTILNLIPNYPNESY